MIQTHPFGLLELYISHVFLHLQHLTYGMNGKQFILSLFIYSHLI